MENKPLVSLLIPCYNEAPFIGGVIEDILAQDYPKERTEILFLDGGSTDGTREKLEQVAKRYERIRWLPNPGQYVPQAMNLGIAQSLGELIIRLDAHGSYPRDYVSRLVYWQQRTDAENVGGVWKTVPRSTSAKARAIAAVLSHPLGVGNSHFRLGVEEVREVDTVPFGCYPRRVFDTYGTYDERLIRNQDIELNKRIRRAGGRILLVPEVHCIYYARDRYRALWENNFQTGRWVPLTIHYTGARDALSLRHWIPAGFVVYLAVCLLGILLTGMGIIPGVWLMIGLLPFLLYLLLITLAAARVGWRQNSLRVAGFAWLTFPWLHVAYGCGIWKGLWEVAGEAALRPG